MNICLISAEYPPQVGGVGDYTRHLGAQLQRSGNRVTVLTNQPGPVGGDEMPSDSMPDHAPCVVRAVSSWDWRCLRQTGWLVASVNPDVIHIQYQTMAYGMHPAICMLPRWLRWRGRTTPVVTTFHDLLEPYLFPRAGALRRWVTSSLATSSDGVLATNASDAVRLRGWGAANPHDDSESGRVEIVPIGSNVIPSTQAGDEAIWARQRLGISSDTPLIGFYGFMNQSKGIDTLIEAFLRLRAGGTGGHLIFLGESSGSADAGNQRVLTATRARIAEAGLSSHVTWSGYQPPELVSRWLYALDCCVLPFVDGASLRRGTLLTALAHGTPTVTTWPTEPPIDGGPLPQLDHGEHCLMVGPRRPGQLAAAVRTLLADKPTGIRLGEAGRRFAAHFAWDVIAGQTVSCYQKTMARHGRAAGIRVHA